MGLCAINRLQSESEKSLYSGQNMQQQHWKVCGGLDNLIPFNIFVQRLVETFLRCLSALFEHLNFIRQAHDKTKHISWVL